MAIQGNADKLSACPEDGLERLPDVNRKELVTKQPRRISSGFVITLFAAIALTLSAIGLIFYHYERNQFRKAAGERLAAIAHWQTREIQNWRTERIRDATQFTTSPYNARRFVEFLRTSARDDGRDILAFLDNVKETALYHDLMLADTLGNVRLSSNETLRNLSIEEKRDLAVAVHSGKIYLADIHRGETPGTLHLNIYAPIWKGKAMFGDSTVIGALILQLDPETYLYPLIETWPTPSETGETVLLRRDEDTVVFLSRLRFRNNAPLTFRLPISGNGEIAGIMAGRGVTGIVTATDYHHAKVMSELNHIPDSPWYLITKIDESEIAAPLKMVVALTFGITFGLILFLGNAMLLWWKRTEAIYLRHQYADEREKRALLENIATERKRAEEQLRHYNEQLEKTVEERTATIRSLERQRLEDEKQVALGRMAARIAHEINNPLTGIKNSFTLVKRAIPADHRHYSYVELIDRELNRIARIVRQMFELYRQEREKISKASPAAVIREVALLLEGNANSRQVTLNIETSQSEKPVLLREDSLRQVLFGVVQNGIEASPPGGCVCIESVCHGDTLAVTVADQGPGIPDADRSKIFEPFYTTKEGLTTGGLGLGLSITRGLLENLGGTLTFESVPDNGTTFTIIFPIMIPETETIHD
jgi:signal transduction histidine kinase